MFTTLATIATLSAVSVSGAAFASTPAGSLFIQRRLKKGRHCRGVSRQAAADWNEAGLIEKARIKLDRGWQEISTPVQLTYTVLTSSYSRPRTPVGHAA